MRATLIALAVLVSVGCAADPPPDQTVTIEQDKAYRADGGTYRRSITAVSPPWGKAPAETVSAVEQFAAEGARLPSYRDGDIRLGSGGGGSFAGGGMESIEDVVRRGPVLLCVMGGLAVLAGIVLIVWAGRWTLGLAVLTGGGVLIAAGVLFEVYPWVVLVAAVIALVVGVWWIVDARFAGRAKVALSAVVRGVEASTGAEAVKEAIASAATLQGKAQAVKDTISAAKRKAGVA